MELPIGMMDARPDQIRAFTKMVAAGESPRLAEMLALRKGPALDTDTVHFAGMGMSHLQKCVGPAQAEKVANQARAAGIPINDSWVYNGSVADERGGGDPDAWVGPGDGKDKIKNVIRNRGGACETLGVEFGESQQRVDKAQSEIETRRAKKKKFKEMEKQVKADGIVTEFGA